MMELLLARAGLKWGKPVVILLALAAFLAIAGLGAWRAMVRIDNMIARAAESARVERDAHWRAEIEASNVAVERARADQIAATAAAEAKANAELATLRKTLSDMEAANAALPDADRCGLGRDRVRLLPN